MWYRKNAEKWSNEREKSFVLSPEILQCKWDRESGMVPADTQFVRVPAVLQSRLQKSVRPLFSTRHRAATSYRSVSRLPPEQHPEFHDVSQQVPGTDRVSAGEGDIRSHRVPDRGHRFLRRKIHFFLIKKVHLIPFFFSGGKSWTLNCWERRTGGRRRRRPRRWRRCRSWTPRCSSATSRQIPVRATPNFFHESFFHSTTVRQYDSTIVRQLGWEWVFSTAMVSPLLRLPDNHCNFEECERSLKKARRFDELIILYKNKGMHKKGTYSSIDFPEKVDDWKTWGGGSFYFPSIFLHFTIFFKKNFCLHFFSFHSSLLISAGVSAERTGESRVHTERASTNGTISGGDRQGRIRPRLSVCPFRHQSLPRTGSPGTFPYFVFYSHKNPTISNKLVILYE